MPRKIVPSGVPNVTVKVSPGGSEDKPEPKPEESGDEEQRQAAEDIALAHEEAARGSVGWISRVNATGQKAYAGEAPSHRITQKFLAENYGGGTFEIEHRRPREKGGGTVRDSVDTIRVDDTIPPRVPAWVAVEKPVAPSPNGVPSPSTQSMNDVLTTGVLTVVKSMQDASTTNAQLTQAAIERLREPKAEGLTVEKLSAVAVPFMSGLAAIATAIINRPVPAPPDPTAIAVAIATLTKQKDPAELIAALAPILRPPPGPPADVTQLGGMIAALKGLVDLKDSLSPGNGSDTGNPWVDLGRDVAKALPEVASVAKAAMAQRAANAAPRPTGETLVPANGAGGTQVPPEERRALLTPAAGEPLGPPRVAAPSSVVVQPPAPDVNGAQTEEAMLRVFLKGISDEMLQHAKANRQPVRIAQAFLDLHEQYIEQIAWWVEQPNCVENFMKDFPEWREHKAWLEEFIQTIDKETHEAPQP